MILKAKYSVSKDKLADSLCLHQWKCKLVTGFVFYMFLEQQRFNMGHKRGIRRLSWLMLQWFNFELFYLKCHYSENQQDLILKNIFPQRRMGWPAKTVLYGSDALDACDIFNSYKCTFMSYMHKLWLLFFTI